MRPVLARKYRPQTFDEVMGQEAIVETLRNALATGRVAHGFIFSGHRGIGKTTIARILAKAMNCRRANGPTAMPCGECEACREIADGNSVDVLEIDAASNRGIDEIRQLRDNARYRPARDRTKFFILDEAHQLTDDAFNALLKTLEEPPEWVMFVLATTEPEALPATIRSRCQHYAFRALSYTATLQRLRQICEAEGIAAEPQALELAAEAGEGSLRDALSLLDQVIAHDGERLQAETVRQLLGRVAGRRLFELMSAVRENDSARVLSELHELLQTGVTPAQLARQLLQWLRVMLLIRTLGPDSPLIEMSDQERKLAGEAAEWFSEERLARYLQIMLRTAGDLRHAPAERLHLELGMLKLIHAARLTRLEDVIQALDPAGKTDTASTEQKKKTDKTAPVPGAPHSLAAATSRAEQAAPKPEPARSEAPFPAPPVAAPVSEETTGGRSSASASPSDKLRQFLRDNQRSTMLDMLNQVSLQWDGNTLCLNFDSEQNGAAAMFSSPAMQAELRQAARQALGFSPEIRIQRPAPGPDLRAEKAKQAAEAEARAAQHPALKLIRELLQAQIIETSPIKK